MKMGLTLLLIKQMLNFKEDQEEVSVKLFFMPLDGQNFFNNILNINKFKRDELQKECHLYLEIKNEKKRN